MTTILLKGYKQRFAGAPLASSLHYLRGLMSGVLPANPLASHDTEPGRLRDPEFLRRALRHRTGRMLFTLSLRLRKHVAKVGPFHAWCAAGRRGGAWCLGRLRAKHCVWRKLQCTWLVHACCCSWVGNMH